MTLREFNKFAKWMSIPRRRWLSNAAISQPPTLADVPRPIPGAYYRGGTSKGIFIHSNHLPEDTRQWRDILLPMMGSPDRYNRQLNGMGGGISSLSKVVVVSPSSREDIDCEYTFVQVPVGNEDLDLSGNCGNLSSVAGVFAVDTGICRPRIEADNRGRVRSWNINTNKIIDTVFPVDSQGRPDLDQPEAAIAGVEGKGSCISLEFLNPAGAKTGKLLPTGNPVDVLELPGDDNNLAEVSLVDATNPTVILPFHELRILLSLSPGDLVVFENGDTLNILEAIRTAGAERMGLPRASGQPKIAVVQPPSTEEAKEVDLAVRAISMGVPHKAIPMTVGLCLGVAAGIKDTVVERTIKAANRDRNRSTIRLRHPSGVVEVGSIWSGDRVQAASVIRTGRRLMVGNVYW
jgi:2-methylaconitate cis-trans-isomerase PrpF